MVTTRDARPADAPSLGALHVRAWRRAYRGGLMPDAFLDGLSIGERADRWERTLAREPRPGAARLVAEDEQGRVIGFTVVGPAGGQADAIEGEVYSLNVEPDAWGGGAGRALLAAGTEHLRQAGFTVAILWVHSDNLRARAFYERAGWHPDGEQRQAELDGVDVPEVRYRVALVDG